MSTLTDLLGVGTDPAPVAAPAAPAVPVVAPAVPVVAAAEPPAPPAVPVAAAAEPPARGAVVRWTETDPYDDLNPVKIRYGVVIEYTPLGAALVLQLGEIHAAAHFGPDSDEAVAVGAPVVSNLTVVS